MEENTPSKHFIKQVIEDDLASGKWGGKVVTRFPPEPNGHLHIGHAKAICLNFGVAADYQGVCSLRFDDTNPIKEESRFVDAIKRDIKWLGWDWGDRLFFASDYFEQLYGFALSLIDGGKAYVCDLSADEIREYRGTLKVPGRESPYRNRSNAENRELFEAMRHGDFPDGARVLRAKIDMVSPNLNMRDPVMYRIQHAHHHRTGNQWCIYPMYDFAHGQSDSIEGVTHSLCSLEFEDHRPLYDWFLEALAIHHPQQIEFARLNLSYTVVSKRLLSPLIESGHVSGWDDPRMPTLSGLRRRGYTPESIRDFCDRVGVAKRMNVIELSLLEHCLRDDLNRRAPRAMAVLRPLRLVIENYPEEKVEYLDGINNPEDPSAGTRPVPFSRVLYIEHDDFREEAPRKFFRLVPGREVRLRYGYYITCTGFSRDEESGEITEVRCTYDPETRGGKSPDGRRVRGTIHWVSIDHAVPAEVRLYDRLFSAPNPARASGGSSIEETLNPHSLEVVNAFLEPSLENANPGDIIQFERLGYFCVDSTDSRPGRLVFNRAVTLRDSWARIERQSAANR